MRSLCALPCSAEYVNGWLSGAVQYSDVCCNIRLRIAGTWCFSRIDLKNIHGELLLSAARTREEMTLRCLRRIMTD